MALIPELALQTRVPQIQMPDWSQIALTGANIGNQQFRNQLLATQAGEEQQDRVQQRRLQELAFADLQQKRQAEQELDAYLRGQTPGTSLQQLAQPGGRAAQVPSAPPGTYARAPQPSAFQELSPATKAPPDATVYSRAPEAMQPPALQAPARPPSGATPGPGMALDPAEMLRRGGRHALPLIQGMQGMQNDAAVLQQNQFKATMAGIDKLDELLALPSDQATLDQLRGQLQQQAPQLAGFLPQTYDKAALDAYRLRLVPLKQRLQASQVGLQPIYGTDAQGNPVLMQLSQSGQAVPTQLPPGVQPAPATKWLDTATGFQGMGPGGQAGPFVPKDIQGKATQEATGQAAGKYAGERPQMARKGLESIAQLEGKHAVVNQDIDRALSLVRTAQLPTTGAFGALLKAVPGTSAHDLGQLIEGIGANVGFAELQAIREASPTGGALGPVSDFENRQLQAVLGSLRQSQSQEQLTTNLQRLKTFLTEAKTRRTEAYQRDFGDLAPAPGRQGSPPVGGRTVLPKARAAELFKKLPDGVTPEMAIEQWRLKGIEVEP